MQHAGQVVVAGPMASMYPDPLFGQSVTVLGGIAVHGADELLQVVNKGGSGYFFGRWAEKMAIVSPHP
jgi:uncharacterized protein (DUF4213/DUF364 family)